MIGRDDTLAGFTVGFEPNYYEVLNVAPDASRSEIRASYMRLRNTFGSKSQALYSLFDHDEAQRMLADVEQAYRVLNDEIQRPIYDRQIGLQSLRAIELDDELELRVEPAAGHVTEAERPWPATEREVRGWSTRLEQPHHSDGGLSVTPMAGGATKATRVTSVLSREQTRSLEELIQGSDDLGDGGLLMAIREYAKVSREELQERTKICIEYIRALEENDYPRLPQLIFVKGFLRSYLKYLCAPRSEEIVAAFSQRLEDWRQQSES